MLATIAKQIQQRFIRWCYIHLIVSVYSLVILVCWGLPFCPLSFLGNLIFSPVLLLFLLLCTMLFFTELCYIPNGSLIYLIELFCSGWLYALRLCASNTLNIPFAQPSIIQLITISCAALIIIFLRASYIKKILYALTLLACSFWFMAHTPKGTYVHMMPCNNGHLRIIKTIDELTIIDPGYLGRFISASSFVEYTLLPFLIKRLGTKTIDHLILLKPGTILFYAIERLLKKAHIKHIYVPYFKGDEAKAIKRAYMCMKEQAHKKQTLIHNVDTQDIIIIKHAHTDIKLQPLHNVIKKQAISFPAYLVSGVIDNKSFTIYPAQYNNKNVQTKDKKNP